MHNRPTLIKTIASYAVGLLCLGVAFQVEARDQSYPDKPELSGASAWSTGPFAAIRLVSGVASVDDSKKLPLGLQFHLQPGWKIYWRSPGDAGVPPLLNWSGSHNIDPTSADILWPAPERFDAFGLTTAGYGGEVTLPMEARAIDAGQPVELHLNVQYLVCSTICVPGEGNLALSLPTANVTGVVTSHQAEIDRFLARVPEKNSTVIKLQKVTAESSAEDEGGIVRATFHTDRKFARPDLFIEGPAGAIFGVPVVELQDKDKAAVFTVPFNARRGVGILQTPLVFTLVDQESFGEFRREPNIVQPAPSIKQWLRIVFLALVGGLILNLMPCVLPVLALKFLAITEHRDKSINQVRKGFLASAVGIIAAFLMLAVGVLILKAVGVFVGWGIQFQQPVFLTAMAFVLTLFAANMFGFYEISLPSALATRIGTDKGSGLSGQFWTGAFAALLATPCSAPFLGTAVGFALSRDVAETGVVFLALGVGLAIPYLLIAAFPHFVKLMPRPGKWMVQLRHFLGILLLGSSMWLLSIIAVQASLQLAVAIGALFALSLLVLSLRRWLPLSRLGQKAGIVVVALGLVAILSPIYGNFEKTERKILTHPWQSFAPRTIAQRIGEGKVVFVNVTADWCITCKANEIAVLRRKNVVTLLSDSSLTPMRADWTRPDPEIARYLASFSRYGIPFDVVYGPGAPQGVVLPEILTEEDISDAVAKARGE